MTHDKLLELIQHTETHIGSLWKQYQEADSVRHKYECMRLITKIGLELELLLLDAREASESAGVTNEPDINMSAD